MSLFITQPARCLGFLPTTRILNPYPAFFACIGCSTYRAVELNVNRKIYMFKQIPTLISRTAHVARYETVNEPIPQHTAVNTTVGYNKF